MNNVKVLLNVMSHFYVLGECDMLIMARSGFSEWTSRRRYLINCIYIVEVFIK
jgi:hypothetical protein